VKSEAQITQERKAWARGLFVPALHRHDFIKDMPHVPQLVQDRVNEALLDGLAIAEEWGVIGEVVAEEAAG
jgi:hypothetical protein